MRSCQLFTQIDKEFAVYKVEVKAQKGFHQTVELRVVHKYTFIHVHRQLGYVNPPVNYLKVVSGSTGKKQPF